MTIDEKAKEILKHRGEKNQILKALEEMAELQNALLHSMDGRGSVSDVREELADVCLMAKQLQIIFNLTDDRLEERMHDKADRELGRIGVAEPKGSGWIAFNEEEPKVDGSYIVSISNGDGTSTTTVADWFSIRRMWGDCDGYVYTEPRKWFDDEKGNRKLIAWMPLPEPHEGGAE